MKIEVGEFVRFGDGKIYKITEIREADELFETTYYLNDNCFCYEDEIKNHSKDIIDLLEAGDIVTYAFDGFGWTDNTMVKGYTDGRTGEEVLTIDGNDIHNTHNIKIKSILTYEQYKKNCFRLEE